MSQGWSRRTRARALGACLALSLAACGSDPGSDRDDASDRDEESAGGSGSSKRDGGAGSRRDGGGTTRNDGGRSGDDDDDPSGGGTGSSAWCKVKPLFEKHCTSCHDGEGTAGSPMGLTRYADTQEDAPLTPGKKVYETIATRVHDSRDPMPPKGLLSASDLALIDAWIEAGAEGGDAECAGGGGDKGVAGGAQAAAWPAECTEQYRYKIVARGATAGSKATVARGQETHPQIFLDAPWGSEERQALAMRNITDNRKVLHHWILYSAQGAFITGWAPSDDDEKDPLPDDVGMYLPNGPRSLRLDMHYFNLQGTQTEEDASGVEICAVPKALWRKHTASVTMSFASLGQGFVLAPANKMGHESTGTCRINAREPIHILTASPHAHTLARAMRFTVQKANGEKITMHEGPFNFEEQSSYPMKQELVLNTGDVVTTTCIFDNATSRNVTFGESTTNEMCFNFAVYYPMNAFSCSFF